MTSGYQQHAANADRWAVDLPDIAARWGLGSALAELEATSDLPEGTLPADAHKFRMALRTFVAAYVPASGDLRDQAFRADPFIDPTAA